MIGRDRSGSDFGGEAVEVLFVAGFGYVADGIGDVVVFERLFPGDFCPIWSWFQRDGKGEMGMGGVLDDDFAVGFDGEELGFVGIGFAVRSDHGENPFAAGFEFADFEFVGEAVWSPPFGEASWVGDGGEDFGGRSRDFAGGFECRHRWKLVLKNA